MFNKKKKKKEELSLLEITSRLRGFILDSQIQNGHELCVILGCSSMSDELQEREEEESEKRTKKISFLVPMLYAHAHALAEGAVEYQRSNTPEDMKGVPDEIWWESRNMMTQVSLSALLGSVSQLVDMGLLEIPKEHKKK
jgi:hypothetical protein